MAYTMKEGQGSLFKNDKKQSDNHPDFTGTVLINGVTKRLAAWKKVSQNGLEYMSITVTDFPTTSEASGYQQASNPSDVKDDMPY